jgi:hypothetical protein
MMGTIYSHRTGDNLAICQFTATGLIDSKMSDTTTSSHRPGSNRYKVGSWEYNILSQYGE